MATSKKRILFVSEAVTLAHVARPAVLAQSLADSGHTLIFAADSHYAELFPSLPAQKEPLYSIPSDRFRQALAKGRPVYDAVTLKRYVEDDLALFDRVRPDVVIGDFRLSLSVSARLRGIPYATISNVYWSPYARQSYPVPELPLTRLVGVPAAQLLFDLIRPLAFALHTIPMNRVRRHFGLPALVPSLQRVYTDADVTLYADLPGLVETVPMPPSHHFIGPILWSPPVPPPSWWEEVDDSATVIYMTPGSSGSARRLPGLARALADLPAEVLVATAGQWQPGERLSGVFAADYLPGEAAARRAAVVVCNGGSPTTAQALEAGVPVVGLPDNLDQYLNMAALERAGVGISLRSGRVTPTGLVAAVQRVLDDSRYRESAVEMGREIKSMRTAERFRQALESLW